MKRRIITCVICVVFTVFLSALLFLVLNNAVPQLPNITQISYNQNAELYPLTVSKWKAYEEKISMKDVTFCAELEETTIKDFTVTPVLTNENYFSVMNIPLTGNLPKNKKAAVISSDLALKLYFNTDVIGKKLVCGGEEYSIGGVYKKPNGFINEISTDGKERIYFYYSDYPNYENQEVHSLCFKNNAPSAPLIEQMNLSQYHAENLGEKAKILSNFKSLFLLIIFISLSVIAFRIWYKTCEKFYSEIKVNLSENYFFKSIRSIPLKYVLFCVTAVGIPFIVIFVFTLLDVSFFIPSKYMPYDNIFDIPYYFSKIIEEHNLLKSLALSGDNYSLNLFHNSFCLLLFLFNAFVTMYCVFCAVIFIKTLLIEIDRNR